MFLKQLTTGMKMNCPQNPIIGPIGFFKIVGNSVQFMAHPKFM